MQEVETKLSVHPSFVLPDLSHAVPGGSAAGKPDRDIRSTYWDTADLRLARAEVTLRHRRTDGQDEGWQWKAPLAVEDAGGLARTEITVPGAPSRPPSAVRDRLAVLSRTAPLTPVARLRTLRRVVEVHRDGAAVAEVTDDEVTVVEAGRIAARFREVEVELVGDGDAAVMRSVVGTLVASGATRDTQRPKLFVALGPRAEGPGDLSPSVTDPERQAFARVLAEQLDRLRTVDPRARRCAGRAAEGGPADDSVHGSTDGPGDGDGDGDIKDGDGSDSDGDGVDACTDGEAAAALAGVLGDMVALVELVEGTAPPGLAVARDAAAEVAATATALAVLHRDPGPVGASAADLAVGLTAQLAGRWSRLSGALGSGYLAELEDVVTLLHERPDRPDGDDGPDGDERHDRDGDAVPEDHREYRHAPIRLDDIRKAARAEPVAGLPQLAAAVALLSADGADTGKLVRRTARAVEAARTVDRHRRARDMVRERSHGSDAFAAGYVAARLGDGAAGAEEALADAVMALDGKRLRRLGSERLPGR